MAASVDFILRTDKENDKGLSPIYLRITKDRKHACISMGSIFNVKESQWDKKKHRVKNHLNTTRFNIQLDKILIKSQELILQHENEGIDYSSADIRRLLMEGKNKVSFIDFVEEKLTQLKAQKKTGTYTKYRTVLNNLMKYLKGKDLSFKEMNYEFLKAYEEYLRVKDNPLSVNSIHSNMKTFRKFINDAIRERIIPVEQNPFIKYKIPKESIEKHIFLEVEELQRLEEATFDDKSLELVRDMFIFATYAAGIRIGDLLTLKASSFDGEYLNYTSRKTKKRLSVKLPPKALKILVKYNADKKESHKLIFPFMPVVDWNDEAVVFKTINSCSAQYNRDLKKIALKAKVKKKLSSHVARHTFATMLLSLGARSEHIQKLLGHKDLTTTFGYAKLRDKDLDDTMDLLDNK